MYTPRQLREIFHFFLERLLKSSDIRLYGGYGSSRELDQTISAEQRESASKNLLALTYEDFTGQVV